jgi:hypothetical protein
MFFYVLNKRKDEKFSEDMEQYEKLLDMIDDAEQRLHAINNKIDSKQIDKTYNLTKNAIDVLDIYEQSHIKIPVDIIEELTEKNDWALSKDDVFNFIQNRRDYWKLENTKKVYEKGLK